MKSKILSLTACLVACAAAAVAAGAEDAPWQRVMDVAGKAESRQQGATAWKPLIKGLILKKGTKLRTSSQGAIQMGFDPSFHAGARLMPNSRAVVLSEKPLRIFLEEGSLLLLCENEVMPPIENSAKRAAAGEPIFVSTPQASVELRAGGFGITTDKQGTVIRVYSESLRWSARPPKKGQALRNGYEGFRYDVDISGSEDSRRMIFTDYVPWQEWMKNFMEMRDDALSP